MKVNILDAHDRLKVYLKQNDYISQGCTDCIKNRPPEFENHPFYIFAFAKTIGLDEKLDMFNKDLYQSYIDPNYIRRYQTMADVPEKRMIWSPRLTKPEAQTNSMLFKSYPPTDKIKVIWIIPDENMWKQFQKDNLAEHKIVIESIHEFRNHKYRLEAKEDDDLSEDQAKAIYMQIAYNKQNNKLMDNLYKDLNDEWDKKLKPTVSEAS